MEWSDEGIVLSARRLGESGAVLSVLSSRHGRHAGLVRGGAGRRARGSLQPGNRVRVTWRARLPEQLGGFVWEAGDPLGTRWLDDAARLDGVASACTLVETVLPERQIFPGTFQALQALLTSLGGREWTSLYVRWELGLLADLGFGLDLTCCAATGTNDGLAFVSPKSGRAVCRSAGEPYRDRLLPLPAFLLGTGAGSSDEILAGLDLTGFFFERHVLGPGGRPLPAARSRLVGRIKACSTPWR